MKDKISHPYFSSKIVTINETFTWRADGFLHIEDSVATFIFNYRRNIEGVYGEIDGYEKDGNIQKFYIRGREYSSGVIMSFIITTFEDKVIIRAYKKLNSNYDLIFDSYEIDIE